MTADLYRSTVIPKVCRKIFSEITSIISELFVTKVRLGTTENYIHCSLFKPFLIYSTLAKVFC